MIKPLLLLPLLLGACLPILRAASTAIGRFDDASAWNFHLGEEFPGAKGGVEAREAGGVRAIAIRYDFSGGGQYVAAALPDLDIAEGTTELRIKARSDRAQRVSIRIADDTWQYHQIATPYTQAGEWQTLRVPLAPFRPAFSFGGANDRKLHFPLRQIWIVVDKPDGAQSAATGTIEFTDLVALAAPAAAPTPAAAAQAATSPTSGPAASTAIGRFDDASAWNFHLGEEFPGAKGGVEARDAGGVRAIVIRYDFSGGGQYVAAALPDLEIAEGTTELRLKARSDRAQRVSIRIADDTWQYHQIATPYTQPGEWQTLRVPLAPFRPAFSFGGANDRKLHFPLRQIWIVVDKPDGAQNAATGTIEFTDLVALAAPAPAPAAAPTPAAAAQAATSPTSGPAASTAIGRFDDASAWNFHLGEEFPGAKGGVEAREAGGVRAIAIRYDFSGGGQYVAAALPDLDIAEGTTELRIKARSDRAQRVSIRIADDTFQYHQIATPYTQPGEWQTLRVPLSPFRPAFSFGGANDRKLHFPLRQIWIVVDKPDGAQSAASGTLEVTDLVALAAGAPAPSAPAQAAAAPAAETPRSALRPSGGPRTRNERMGVATHFGNGGRYLQVWNIEPDIAAAADLGVAWIRDDFHWKEFETQKGRYELPPRARRWIDAAHAAGLKVILIFNGGNPLYENPFDPDAYAKAAAAAAVQLRGKVQAIEILNEPHNFEFSKIRGGRWNGYDAATGAVDPWVGDYVTLLNRAAKAIKQAVPEMKVIGLGSVPPVNFRQLAMGVAPEVDGITEHPYSIRAVPELVPYPATETILKRDGIATADEQGTYASQVRLYREQSARHKGPRELWMTEWGFATYQEAKPSFFAGVTESAQAKYALRRFAEDLGLGVEVSIAYALKNDGTDRHDAEDNFGLLDHRNGEKPAFAAVRRLAEFMAPYYPAAPAIDTTVFTQNIRTDTHPVTWDGARLAAPGTVRVYGFRHKETKQALLLVWSVERADGDLQPRLADLEVALPATPRSVIALDLLTGLERPLPFERRGAALWLSQVTVPDRPIVIRFE